MKIPENPINPLSEKPQIVTPNETNQFDKRLDEETASQEAYFMKERIKEGEAKNYTEAEKLVEKNYEFLAMIKSIKTKIKSLINKEDSLRNIIASVPEDERYIFYNELICRTKEFNDLNHVEIAHDMINNNEGSTLVFRLERFQGLDHNDIAERLIESGQLRVVVHKLEKFKNLDYQKTIDKILDCGSMLDFAITVDRISMFKNIDLNVIANKLIDKNYLDVILYKFFSHVNGLDSEIANRLVDTGKAEIAIVHIDKFKNVNSKELVNSIFSKKIYDHRLFSSPAAEKLIDIGQVEKLANNLDKFILLDSEVAFTLIDKGMINQTMNNIKSFDEEYHIKIINKFFEKKEYALVAENLNKFKNLDKDIASKLFKCGYSDDIGYEVANNIINFQSTDHSAIALELINNNYEYYAVEQLDKFQGINHLEIAQKLIEAGKVASVAKNLDKFQGLDTSVALALIKAGEGHYVAHYLEKFHGLDYTAIVLKLIEAGKGGYVPMNLEKFYGLDHTVFALKLISAGEASSVVNHLQKFHSLSSDVAKALIEAGKGESVAKNLEKFPRFDHLAIADLYFEEDEDSFAENFNNFKELKGDIAIALIETGMHGDDVSRNIQSFQSKDHPAIALALIDNGYGYILAEHINEFEGVDNTEIAERILDEDKEEGIEEVTNNLENFHDLSKEIAEKLFNEGLEENVADNIKSFKDEDHIAIADIVLDSGNGSGCWSLAKNLGNFKGINSLEVARKLIEEDYIDAVSENLKNFHGLDQDIAIAIFNNHDASFADNLESFENLDVSLAIKLVEHGYANNLNTHLKVFNLPPEVEKLVESHHLILSEALIYYQASPKERAEKSIVEILKAKIPEWKDELNISGPFEEGSKIFGEDKMFEYLNRKGLTRHDGLHDFNHIIELYRISDLSPKEFYNNILRQVNDDESEYYNGTAHHQLNDLSRNTIDITIEKIIGKPSSLPDMFEFDEVKKVVDQYKHIEKLSTFFLVFNTIKDVFSSWKNFKKYIEVYNLLEQKDILDQLSKFKDFPEKKKLQDYIETLAFHPNISMDKVLSFWRTPENFFDLPDSHTPTKVHNRKKPSNFIEFPNLDLSAEELRDSLVEGDYDAIQSFRPFSIEYGLSKNTYAPEPFVSALNRALGKRSENKKGEAKNPPKLFKELQKISQERQISFQDLLVGNIEISDEDKSALLTSLYRKDIGLSRPDVKIETYRAKINKKSDPDAVVAGNDTACCMPFGSGKNNVYTFNPNCSLFTLQKQTNKGKWRTIAQSVLTEDVFVGRKIPDIISDVQKGRKHLNELLTDDILSIQKSFIACDNIEVAGSFSDKNDEIKFIYQDFFREYLKQFSKDDNIEDSKIVIGQGYADALTDLPQETNVFIPRAPVGYSDKMGDKVYTLSMSNNLQTKLSIFDKKIINQESFPKTPPIDFLPQGVEPLTFRDALPVAYIEGKAYADNESLIEYLHNMENVLIAKDVNNSTKKRPNMSLKYIGDDNKMHGYILAYEGKMHKRGENVVYISDLASDKNIRAGGSLLIGFTEMYKRNYIDTGKIIPIYAQLRENTSYPIIKKQLDKLAKGTGIKFQMKEVRTYNEGNDLMYEVMILPILSNENLI